MFVASSVIVPRPSDPRLYVPVSVDPIKSPDLRLLSNAPVEITPAPFDVKFPAPTTLPSASKPSNKKLYAPVNRELVVVVPVVTPIESDCDAVTGVDWESDT